MPNRPTEPTTFWAFQELSDTVHTFETNYLLSIQNLVDLANGVQLVLLGILGLSGTRFALVAGHSQLTLEKWYSAAVLLEAANDNIA